ncbi:MAG: acyl-CoA dehydrogenase [Sphingomonadales bacterium]|nr:acyl-CoA dehydrogenase [Sphingomonadales bacterium]
MLLELSENQSLVLGSLDRLAVRFEAGPLHDGGYVQFSEALQSELRKGGFTDLARFDDCSMLDAALVVERIARLPFSAEVAASAIVGPAVTRALGGTLALCEGLGRPTRFLAQADRVCLRDGNDIYVAEIDAGAVEPVSSVLAYPLAKLARMPARACRLDPTLAEHVKSLWRLAIAVEAAGLLRGALDRTVAFVKDRQQFQQPLGNFQAIQHRLAASEQIVAATRLLALRAAFTLDPRDTATAALYAQENMRSVIYDCHQFHGAMGLTLEYPLHLWTYRLKFLQGELGGRVEQALALSNLAWWDRPAHLAAASIEPFDRAMAGA